MAIMDDLVLEIQNFIQANDKEPTKICVTKEDELNLAAIRRNQAGGDTTGNVRNDFSTIGGCLVEWNAARRHCE
jgi:hypothetical protein